MRVDFQLFNFQYLNNDYLRELMNYFQKNTRKCFSIRIKAIYLQFQKNRNKILIHNHY